MVEKSIPFSIFNSLKSFSTLEFQSSPHSTFAQAGGPCEAHTDELTQGSSRVTGTTEQHGSQTWEKKEKAPMVNNSWRGDRIESHIVHSAPLPSVM